MFTHGTCLGAMLVCISVGAVADDSPTSDETGPAAEWVCSIGILMCVLFVNVFIAVEELWEGFETAKGLPSVAFLGCFMQLLWLEEHGRSGVGLCPMEIGGVLITLHMFRFTRRSHHVPSG